MVSLLSIWLNITPKKSKLKILHRNVCLSKKELLRKLPYLSYLCSIILVLSSLCLNIVLLYYVPFLVNVIAYAIRKNI